MNERAYYNQADLWDQPPAPYQHNVLADILDLLPPDVQTVLDAGCGNGFIANRLPGRLDVTAVDTSDAALAHVKREKRVASVLELPFEDESFDLVMACDVLEHIPEADHARAVDELARVARRRVLVCVPLMENLAAGRTACGVCGRIYHVNQHQRSYTVSDLLKLLGERWQARVAVFSGETVDPRERAQFRLRAELGLLTRWDRACCPHCGSRCSVSAATDATLAAVAAAAEQLPLELLAVHPDRSECIVLYEAGEERKAPSAPPRLLATRRRWDGALLRLPMTLRGVRNRLAATCEPPVGLDGAADDWALEWHDGGRMFRLPRVKMEEGAIVVPSWFLPQALTDPAFGSPAPAGQNLTPAAVGLAVSRAEQFRQELLNVRAELASLQYRAGQADRQAVDLENARGQLDLLRKGAAEEAGGLRAQLDAAARREASMRQELSLAEEAGKRTAGMLAQAREDVARVTKDVARAQAEVRQKAAVLESAQAQCRQWKERHDALALAYRRSWRFRIRHGLKRLGKGSFRTSEQYRRDLLSVVEPAKVLKDWRGWTAGKKSFVMLCHDQRIDRRIVQQAAALTEAGWAGIIVAMSHDAEDHIDQAQGVPVHRIGLKRIIPDCPVYWRHQDRLRLIQWWGRGQRALQALAERWYRLELAATYRCASVSYPLPFDRCYYAAAKHYRADLVVAHDLPALPAAHQLAGQWQAALVYDSHELYTEQHMLSRPQRRLLDRCQRRLVPTADAVITVGQAIARHLSCRYDLPRPHVILNVAALRPGPAKGGVKKFHQALNLCAGDRVVLFQGSVAPSQNMHTLVRGFRRWNRRGHHLVFLGGSEPRLLAELKDLAGDRLGRSIHFMGPVPQEELPDFTASADVGLIPYLPYDLNCRYCMPNKLFEYIQAGLPVLSSDLLEIRRVLAEIGGGMLADMSSPRAVSEALRAMFSRDLDLDRSNLLAARERFSWDTEKRAYLRIIERAWSGKHPETAAPSIAVPARAQATIRAEKETVAGV